MSERSILAVELCLRFDRAAHDYLRQIMARQLQIPALSYQDKWNLYGQVCTFLNQNRHLWVSGCWDFFDNDMKARSDFNMWVNGMMSEEGARKQGEPLGDVYRGQPRFMTFTIAALMVQGSPSERILANACNIPESRLWQAATFQHILSSMRHLNFASIEGSTLYLIPREQDFALTAEDLKHPKFQYLRQIV